MESHKKAKSCCSFQEECDGLPAEIAAAKPVTLSQDIELKAEDFIVDVNMAFIFKMHLFSKHAHLQNTYCLFLTLMKGYLHGLWNEREESH